MRILKTTGLSVTAILYCYLNLFSQDTTIKKNDDPIVSMIDSLITSKYIESNKFSVNRHNKYNFHADSIPQYSESVYRQRIKKMDQKTPMEFVYNDKVKAYIDLYAVRYRKYSQIIMGLTEIYTPMFEQILDKHGVPLELKYLPIVESAMNPLAKSPAGAMGLWQFMLPTGKLFGLEVNSVIDERCDPIKSTEAAAKYLKYLHSLYNDWNMALAAYNAGPGTVNNAIRRSGGKTGYWEIYSYLPRETQGYVPAFIAVNYLMNYSAEHNLYPVEPKMKYFQYDTVHLKQDLKLEHISQLINITIEELKFLNPVYKTTFIPKFDGKKAYLFLPKNKIGEFLALEDSIYNIGKSNSAEELTTLEKTHIVKSGESLQSIANKYSVSIGQIKTWNNLKNNNLYRGQRLFIRVSQENISATDNNLQVNNVNNNQQSNSKSALNNAKKTSAAHKIYIVKSGDSFYTIAQKNGTTINEIKKMNNINSNNLQVGQKLKIPVKGNG
jgi:membrane-bound lytic murein transglycosylase D